MISMLMVVWLCYMMTNELLEKKLLPFSSILMIGLAIFFNMTSMLWVASRIGFEAGIAQ